MILYFLNELLLTAVKFFQSTGIYFIFTYYLQVLQKKLRANSLNLAGVVTMCIIH